MGNNDISFSDLDSREVFAWFERIAKIPRASKNEKAISDYVLKYAQEKGFDAKQDELWNLIIRKDASSAEFANKPTVILQAHMDMVCTAEKGYPFDFDQDPIKLVVEKDKTGDFWLRSDRTTLGADNGIGIAYSMALLDSIDIPHPPLEIVFTTQEEVGMNGANACNIEQLQGKIFINIDSEEEGVFCTSCCSGTTVHLDLPTKKVALSSIKNIDEYASFDIELAGLQGGHSGIEIDKERGNSNCLLGRILADMAKQHTYYLVAIDGGIAHNAIASSTKATIYVRKDTTNTIAQYLDNWKDIFTKELSYNVKTDEIPCTITVTMRPTSTPAYEIYTQDSFEKIVTAMTLLPHGVIVRDRINAMPETSTNFGTIKMHEHGISFIVSIRSTFSSKRDFIESKIRKIASVLSADVRITGVYPGWEYEPKSPIRDIFQKAYAHTYGTGKKAKLEGIHAGLECGIFLTKFTKKRHKVDMFAFGPTIRGAHTPHECVNINSVDRTWKLLTEALKLL